MREKNKRGVTTFCLFLHKYANSGRGRAVIRDYLRISGFLVCKGISESKISTERVLFRRKLTIRYISFNIYREIKNEYKYMVSEYSGTANMVLHKYPCVNTQKYMPIRYTLKFLRKRFRLMSRSRTSTIYDRKCRLKMPHCFNTK